MSVIIQGQRGGPPGRSEWHSVFVDCCVRFSLGVRRRGNLLLALWNLAAAGETDTQIDDFSVVVRAGSQG